jgi:hypothetical protein
MSGEGTAPPAVLDEQTRSLIEGLVQSGVQAALAARAAGSPDVDAAGAQSAEEPVTGGDAVADPLSAAAGAGGGFPAEARAGASGAGRDSGEGDSEGDDSVAEHRADSDGDSAGDGAVENSDQAFTAQWYEARRGESIAPRFNIPDRFDPRYPIGFEAESVAHYRTFCAGGASAGREAEANALYASAAYLTEANNALAETARRLKAIEARIPSSLIERLRDCRWEVSDAQLTLFGVYELTASIHSTLPVHRSIIPLSSF